MALRRTQEGIHTPACWLALNFALDVSDLDRFDLPCKQTLKNRRYFGGVVAFNQADFEAINGFPNTFWGWGGEDDEMYSRIIEVSGRSEYLWSRPRSSCHNLQLLSPQSDARWWRFVLATKAFCACFSKVDQLRIILSAGFTIAMFAAQSNVNNSDAPPGNQREDKVGPCGIVLMPDMTYIYCLVYSSLSIQKLRRNVPRRSKRDYTISGS